MNISVVIATWRRRALVERLLGMLARQTLPASRFEVVVVDDGSPEPVEEGLRQLDVPYRLRVIRQENAGPAAARHAGALVAENDLLVIVDDDMQVGPGFLEAHEALHAPGTRLAVLGRIRWDPAVEMPLSERYRAASIEALARDAQAGKPLAGNRLCTGNVSMRRADYLAVGGFDPSLRLSEDAELGLRLGKAGVQLIFDEGPAAVHSSDHKDPFAWLDRMAKNGEADAQVARKHRDTPEANPWRYLFQLAPLGRPLLAASVLAPEVAHGVARAAMKTAMLADRAGLRSLALRGAGVATAMEYFRGLRQDAGSATGALLGLGRFLSAGARKKASPEGVPGLLAQSARAASDLRLDHEVRQCYEGRYGYVGKQGSLQADLVQKIGLQISAACRLMRLFRDGGQPLLAKMTSRLIRHLYGSDIHWDADLAPGVMFVHGMGMAISHSAVVGPLCILSQNITLGMGRDPQTGKTGAPTLEEGVQVGAGASLIGPIRVGAFTKIMPNAVLTHSVPAHSLVETPAPKVRDRKSGAITDVRGERVLGEVRGDRVKADAPTAQAALEGRPELTLEAARPIVLERSGEEAA